MLKFKRLCGHHHFTTGINEEKELFTRYQRFRFVLLMVADGVESS